MSEIEVTQNYPAKEAVAGFLHRNRSIHTHNLGERPGDKTCSYCDLDATYALAALAAAGFTLLAPEPAGAPR